MLCSSYCVTSSRNYTGGDRGKSRDPILYLRTAKKPNSSRGKALLQHRLYEYIVCVHIIIVYIAELVSTVTQPFRVKFRDGGGHILGSREYASHAHAAAAAADLLSSFYNNKFGCVHPNTYTICRTPCVSIRNCRR